ncbi:MAG: hypothetical protein BJ554DRAFT_8337, partial [Olpidium bornovanus]
MNAAFLPAHLDSQSHAGRRDSQAHLPDGRDGAGGRLLVCGVREHQSSCDGLRAEGGVCDRCRRFGVFGRHGLCAFMTSDFARQQARHRSLVQHDRALINVEYNVAPFSMNERKKRSKGDKLHLSVVVGKGNGVLVRMRGADVWSLLLTGDLCYCEQAVIGSSVIREANVRAGDFDQPVSEVANRYISPIAATRRRQVDHKPSAYASGVHQREHACFDRRWHTNAGLRLRNDSWVHRRVIGKPRADGGVACSERKNNSASGTHESALVCGHLLHPTSAQLPTVFAARLANDGPESVVAEDG